MGFFRKSANQNYDFLSGFSWHVPGVKGMFGLLLWFLVGAIIGNIVAAPIMVFLPGDRGMELAQLIAYPLMFIPAMIASKNISNRNMAFDTGYRIDNNNFAPENGWFLALLCMLGTIGLALAMEPINASMPEMPDWLEKTLNSLTQGTPWISFLMVSIFAPIFEEWLCRGTILRGLLNFERTNDRGEKVRGLEPWVAILISAIVFAVIHMNPWQAIPAFALGCLFGYVYYRTGSLKLTMLMHFTNNTFALILSNIDAFKDAESILDVMSKETFALLFAVAVCFVLILVWYLRKVDLKSKQGNCDPIPAE